MASLLTLKDVVLHEVLHCLSPSDLAPCAAASRDLLEINSSPRLWFQLYCTAFRGHFTPPPTFRELEGGILPELRMESFSWTELVRSRVTMAPRDHSGARLPAESRLKGRLQVEDAPFERAGMIDVVHTGRGRQQCVVLQQPMTPLPLARRIAYAELMVNGGASVGLVSSREYSVADHVGWQFGSVGYHGDEGSIYAGLGMRSYKFGPSFGLDPQLVVPNDATRAPRKADVVGVGIDFGDDRGVGEAEVEDCSQVDAVRGVAPPRPTLFFTKNGEMVGSMMMPFSSMQYLAFALHRRGDQASLNVGTSRYYFDVEAYSQQPRPLVTLVVDEDPGETSDMSYDSESSDE